MSGEMKHWVGIVGTCIGLACAAIGWGVAIGTTQAKIERLDEVCGKVGRHEVAIAQISASLSAVQSTTERIDAKLDKIIDKKLGLD
jgi:uncharacterized coiled-coil protein SlyX